MCLHFCTFSFSILLFSTIYDVSSAAISHLTTCSIHDVRMELHPLTEPHQLLYTIPLQDNPYNGRDAKYTIMICILPLILPKMVTLVEFINISSIIHLIVHFGLVKAAGMPPK